MATQTMARLMINGVESVNLWWFEPCGELGHLRELSETETSPKKISEKSHHCVPRTVLKTAVVRRKVRIRRSCSESYC